MTEFEIRVCNSVPKCDNIYKVCEMVGKPAITNNMNIIKRIILDYGVDTSHFKIDYRSRHINNKEYKPDDIFVENSKYRTSSRLRYLLTDKFHFKERRCENCGGVEWMGKDIPLQTHHINGIRTDNRLENLMLLCPNCHSLTDNYCGKNISKNESKYILSESTCPVCGNLFRNKYKTTYCSKECYQKSRIQSYKKYTNEITKELIINLFKNGNTFSSVGRLYGVSDNTVRKWCKSYGIPSDSKSIKEYIHNMTP